MFHHNHHESAQKRTLRHRLPVAIGIAATAGSMVLASQALLASAAPAVSPGLVSAQAAPLAQPPEGQTWIQGVLTDQAGHRLNNVNVEAWSTDPTATVPVASNLSYAGSPADAGHQSGVYRLALPAGTPYKITFSTVGGVEDGDLFRHQSYGVGGPIMSRTVGGTAIMAKAGRVVDLGITQLVRQGTVSSKTSSRLVRSSVKAGQRGQLTVQVTSPFVSNVTGTVQVRVGGKQVTRGLWVSDQGRITIRLPKLARGSHRIHVRFQGSNTVQPSKAVTVKLKVKPKK